MKIEIRNTVKNKVIIDAYKKALDNLDNKIIKMIEQKDFTLLLCHYLEDIHDEKYINTQNKKYSEDLINYPHRGACTNEADKNYIVVYEKYLQIEHLEAVLYHEIGHFLDGFKEITEDDPDLTLFLSGSQEYQEAYRYDFINNWDKIKCDKRFRLVHYVQNSTPQKIHPTAVIETFAESFGVINHKENDEKTVELYFPTALEVEKELLNKAYGFDFK